jgi:hypothetical protein
MQTCWGGGASLSGPGEILKQDGSTFAAGTQVHSKLRTSGREQQAGNLNASLLNLMS